MTVYAGEPVPDDDHEQAVLRAAYIGWDIGIFVHDGQRFIVAERGGATVITDTARGLRAHMLKVYSQGTAWLSAPAGDVI